MKEEGEGTKEEGPKGAPSSLDRSSSRAFPSAPIRHPSSFRPSTSSPIPRPSSFLTATVIIAALGYFVDIYDLVLFSILRVPSLHALGVADADMLRVGVTLLNAQMIGLLVGGLAWGLLGDRRGRRSVLFGSILLYSLANIANAFVNTVPQYAAMRFLAGLGLAGELGAAVTLVSETLATERRSYGTGIVAGIGILGAVAAALVGGALPWQTAYVVGGAMGLVLLVARFRLKESPMYERASATSTRRGDLRLLLAPRNLATYARVVLVGVPIWFVIGILITFSPELARDLAITGPVSAGLAVLWCYAGAAVGDLVSGILSQRFGRKRIMLAYLGMGALLVAGYGFLRGASPATYYAYCATIGLAAGYWAVFAMNAAEQFGTDIRATAATTAPNLVRGSTALMTIGFSTLAVTMGRLDAAMLVGAVTVVIALLALWGMPETKGKDLEYVEEPAPVAAEDFAVAQA